MLGSYIFGWLSDKCGRKLSFFVSIILQVKQKKVSCKQANTSCTGFEILCQALFGVLSGLVPNYWAFVLLRMVVSQMTMIIMY